MMHMLLRAIVFGVLLAPAALEKMEEGRETAPVKGIVTAHGA